MSFLSSTGYRKDLSLKDNDMIQTELKKYGYISELKELIWRSISVELMANFRGHVKGERWEGERDERERERERGREGWEVERKESEREESERGKAGEWEERERGEGREREREEWEMEEGKREESERVKSKRGKIARGEVGNCGVGELGSWEERLVRAELTSFCTSSTSDYTWLFYEPLLQNLRS